MQQQPAKEYGEYGFKAHKQSGNGGIGVFLRHHLQGVGDAAGTNTGIKDGYDSFAHICKGNILGYKRGYQGQHFQNANREFWLKYLLDK